MATTINAGRVRFVSRGTYNNSTQYYLFDLVDYNGSSYIAKENSLGNLPTNTQYWQLIAEKGNTGNDGQTGPVGPTGNGISSITKTGTSGLVDTYTITYTNGNTTTFTITNGEDGEVTETELNVLREKVANQQKVIDQLPQVTGQGTSITLENTIEAPFTKFNVEGSSTQDGEPSPENEVPIYSAGDNENYLKEEWEQGAYSGSNGVGKIDSNQYVRSKEFSTIEPNKEYTSKCVVNGVEHTQGNIFFYKEDESFISSITNISSTFTTPENAKKVKYNIFKSSGITPEDVDYAKLEKGNKASGYSSYGMGSINEKIQNKNWLNKNSNFKTYNASVTPIDTGIKVENNDGGTYRSVWCEIGKDELSGKTLIIQTSISTYNGAIPRIIVVFNNETAQYIEQIKTITTSTEGTLVNIPNSFPENADRVSLIFYCSFTSATPTGSYVEYKNLQVELGSTVTSFVEHEEQDYSIFVQQPMRSIGDVRDCFVKKDGNWYERHYIGRKIFDGTENWIYLDSRGNYYRFYLINFSSGAGIKPVVSNFFIDRGNSAIGEYDFVQSSGNEFYLQIENKTSVAQLKNYLAEQYASGNPVYVDYLLAEPLDLPCTETQIQQLENKPSTYKDFTYVVSEDETEAYLEVSGIYDLNNLINN